MPMPVKNLTGQRFGLLIVLERAGYKSGKPAWLCRCDCGREKVIRGTSLTEKSNARSCGCRQGARIPYESDNPHFNTTHGGSTSAEYGVWHSMKSRCTNPNVSSYARYGGRGIKVCKRWADSFAAFLGDMGPRPSDEHSIDRVDNNGSYSPENCRWSTLTEQNRNRAGCHSVTIGEVTFNIAEWAERLDLSHNAMKHRIRQGWTNPLHIVFGRQHQNNALVTLG